MNCTIYETIWTLSRCVLAKQLFHSLINQISISKGIIINCCNLFQISLRVKTFAVCRLPFKCDWLFVKLVKSWHENRTESLNSRFTCYILLRLGLTASVWTDTVIRTWFTSQKGKKTTSVSEHWGCLHMCVAKYRHTVWSCVIINTSK